MFVLWDDSDGWYDHVMPPVVQHSGDPVNDFAPTCSGGPKPLGDANDRCGYGARLPFLVISPYAKSNFISHVTIDQTSPIKFIQDNWGLTPIPPVFNTQASYQTIAGSVANMFDFSNGGSTPKVCLSPTNGTVVSPNSSGLCPIGP